ncbi:MAG: DegT/DnrJ/EryC1/StrS family aminotransferase [Ferrovum sp.]|jgi:dTDP-4-amino-4,6-dideoxygalactose transaminase|uniref:DegT/DnrJ/EryC1/StrS family aminotransferase n=1 Tax=Ferrovum sp. TaxID=2609467 RepID=UPI00261F2698|nr:DegT/DnrJ/EryC1/StrS family aminotransferase [Ferrovum sp.]MBW8067639.1 DegT/DnrJ/EryC1/StrS family aminotransferase [Ferrovum sp.]
MNTRPNLAIFGAPPAFDVPLPVGQLYFPSWERYERAFRGIFERQYYNNNGPLHEQLECRLREFFGVKHVLLVSNATLGLMMVADALELTGKVLMPAFTFIASAQSVSRAGLDPLFCDINRNTHQIDVDQIVRHMDEEVSAIMGVNLWGGTCQPQILEKLADTLGVKLYFDSAHAFGCAIEEGKIGSFGQAEVFSFHATKILNATEGGCICTNDDDLALRLRSIRPSYRESTPLVPVVRVANARMSEAQAAVALMSLEDFPENRANNERLYQLYECRLRDIPGIRLVEPAQVRVSNYQYLICEIDEIRFGLSRDQLLEVLKAENVIARRYFYPGLHHCIPYANDSRFCTEPLIHTDELCHSCLQLPIGARVSAQVVEKICDILVLTQANAKWIAQRIK